MIETKIGKFISTNIETKGKSVQRIVSIPYARAQRFGDPKLIKEYDTGSVINSLETFCFPQRRIPKIINLFLKHHMMRPEFLTYGDTITENAFVVNIWTQDISSKKPVLVYIHGGGDNGSGTVPIYDGANLAAKGVVVVTITYRVGNMGYLPVYDESGLNCNRAAMDQQTALMWVRQNIDNFGGDSRNITLMGHSGGALSSLNQFLNPISSGLFDKLILCGGPLPTAKKADETRVDFDRLLEDNNLKCFEELNNLDVKKLLRLKSTKYLGDFIDGKFFKNNPIDDLEDGNYPSMPIMVGANTDEFSMIEIPMFYKKMGIATKQVHLEEALKNNYGSYSTLLKEKIEPESNGIVDLQMKIMELIVFHMVSYRLMEYFSRTCPVYGYRFAYVPNLYGGLRGSYHGAEVAMFFDNLDKMNIELSDKNKQEVEWLQKDWLEFIKTGEIKERQKYNTNTKKITLYEKKPETIDFPHAGFLDELVKTNLYRKVIEKYLENR